jgi:hypothetical protein
MSFKCIHCQEPIDEWEDYEQYANGPRAHRNCAIRAVIGSLAHVEKRCSCYVKGAEETDPPGMSRREAANAAVARWRQLQEEDDSTVRPE